MRKQLLAATAAATLLLLGGCTAKFWQCQVVSCHVGEDGQLYTDEELEAQRAEEYRRKVEEEKKEAQKREEMERAYKEQFAKQQALRQEAVRARIAEDEAHGYKHVALADLYLDQKTLPLGSKRAVIGIYQIEGQLETLVEMPVNNAPKIVLLTDTAPREARAKMLACRRALCRGTFLGHTAKCEVTWLGNPLPIHVCFAVDDIW